MALQVVSTAQLACSFGAAPSVLTVIPAVVKAPTPAATIMDHIPATNIAPFGMCSAPTNPAVIAALGSPVPCVPVTPAPWIPGCPKVTISKKLALDSTSTCMCNWLGVISITNAGQTKTTIP